MSRIKESTVADKVISRLETPSVEKRRHPLRALCIIVLLFVGAGIAVSLLWKPSRQMTPYAADAELTLRSGVHSFLLVGQRDGLCDTLMVSLLDTKQGTMTLLSIPRDTVTANDRRTPKINGAYLQGGRGEEGIRQLLAEVAQLIGFYPDNYVVVDWEGFVALVDTLGGVEFDVPEDLRLPSEGIHLDKGLSLLDGEHALQLVRYRSYTKSAGVGLNDFGRMEVQHRFLLAALNTARKQLSPSLVGALGGLATEYGETNLHSVQFAWLAWSLWRVGTENLRFETLPTLSIRYGDDRVSNLYYEQVDSEKALALLNECLNPYREELTADMVTHRVLLR